MSKFILAFSNGGSVISPDDPNIPNIPDLEWRTSYLIESGILSKSISEFTNDDIGTEVSIPYTDSSGIISGPIIFEVVGVNHHTNLTNKSITLMTKDIIRYAAFDAKEPNNPDSDRASSGNNRWSVSNIRQWLNSSGTANSWFTAQHNYDTAPDTTNVYMEEAGAYADEPGFLAGFSRDVLQCFADITNTTAIRGGGSETTVDKVFLPSYTEMGYGNNNGIAEGSHLSVRFTDYNPRWKSGATGWYWMRSPYVDSSWDIDTSHYVRYVNDAGDSSFDYAFDGLNGIAPLVVLY